MLDCGIRPLCREYPPQWTVVEVNRWDATEDIEWSAAVGERTVQALTLRIVASSRTVCEDVDALGGLSRRSVFERKGHVLERRRVSGALKSGDEGIVCFCRQIEDRFSKGKPER